MEEKLSERDVLSIDAEKYIENHNNVLFHFIFIYIYIFKLINLFKL